MADEAAAKQDEEEKDVFVVEGDQDIKQLAQDTTFAELGVCPEICEAVK